MVNFDKDTTEDTAKSRGSGGPLQSKSISDADAEPSDRLQQPEDERESEASDQTTPDS